MPRVVATYFSVNIPCKSEGGAGRWARDEALRLLNEIFSMVLPANSGSSLSPLPTFRERVGEAAPSPGGNARALQ